MTRLPVSVWLSEGQSSQRDMLLSLQTLKQSNPQCPFNVLASHRFERPEILTLADRGFVEPSGGAVSADEVMDTNATDHPFTSNSAGNAADNAADNTQEVAGSSDTAQIGQNTSSQPRWQFVLEHAMQHNTKVLLTGRNSIEYEAQRAQFEQAGIRLLTGATSVAMLRSIDDKSAFTQHCKAHDIPVAEAWRFDTIDELDALLLLHGTEPLCVKPVTGIFAQGFWCLDTMAAIDGAFDSFEHLYLTDNRRINTQQFLNAYRHSEMVKSRPIPMLLMPYLPGREYSIDVVCEAGEVLAAITRYKVGKVQYIGYDDEVMAVVIPLIRAFQCDGIVSVQTKENATGQHCVLEINSRPAGGIGYTNHSGIDLTQIGFGYWLGLTNKPDVAQVAKQIKPCQVRSIITSVKIVD